MNNPAAVTPARAREPGVLPGPEERIQVIAQLMLEGEWTNATHAELAQLWGCDPSTVRRSAAEASRGVRSLLGLDPETVRAQCIARLDAAYRVAKKDSDAAGMTRATIALAKMAGVAEPGTNRPGDDAKVVEAKLDLTIEALLREYIPTASRHQLAIARAAEGKPTGLSPDEELEFFGREVPVGTAPRNIEVVAGRGSAKSAIAAIAGVVAALTADLSKAKPNDNVRVPLVAPNTELAEMTLAAVFNVFEIPALAVRIVEQKSRSITIRRDDGRKVTLSVHAATRRGVKVRAGWLAALVLDEGAFFGEQSNDVNAADVERAAKPRLLGPMWVVSSPNGADAYVKPRFEQHRVSATDCPTCGGRCRWIVAHGASSLMNPDYNAEAEAEMRSTDPDAADREFGALFVDAAAQWLPQDWIDRAAVLDGDVPPVRGSYYVATMDPATRGNGWTLIIGRLDEQGRYEVSVARELRGSKSDPLDAAEVFADWAPVIRAYGCDNAVYSDQASFDSLRVIARGFGLSLVEDESKTDEARSSWRSLYEAMAAGNFLLPKLENIAKDLAGIRRTHTLRGGDVVEKIGIPRKPTADGRHYDFAPAIRGLVSKLRYGALPAQKDPIDDDEADSLFAEPEPPQWLHPRRHTS